MALPRNLPVTREERLENVFGQYAKGSTLGLSKFAAPVPEFPAEDTSDKGSVVWFSDTEPSGAVVGDFWVIPE